MFLCQLFLSIITSNIVLLINIQIFHSTFKRRDAWFKHCTIPRWHSLIYPIDVGLPPNDAGTRSFIQSIWDRPQTHSLWGPVSLLAHRLVSTPLRGTARRLAHHPHPYKGWFVLLPNQCGASQSTPIPGTTRRLTHHPHPYKGVICSPL